MSKKPSLYTAAGIRVILEKIASFEATMSNYGIARDRNTHAIDEATDALMVWKAELQKTLKVKEKWGAFYRGLREQA